MFYLYKNNVYMGRGSLPSDANLDDVLNLAVISPPVNEWQYHAGGGILDAKNLTYTLNIVNIRRYARCNKDWIVQLLTEQLMEADLVPVPYKLNTRIALGWIWDGETFAPPDIPLYLESERQRALNIIQQKHAEMLVMATGGATNAEQDTWGIQLAAAQDIINGGTGDGILKPKKSETLLALAEKVIKKSSNYKKLVGIAGEIKRTAEESVELLALDKMDDLVSLDALLISAKQRAEIALSDANANAP